MIQSLQQEKKSDGEVLSVHRPISRAEWLTIHNHSAAEYRQSEWNLPFNSGFIGKSSLS